MEQPRILVIDDNSAILSMLQQALQLEGYVTYTALNGREGLALVELINPHLVLLDQSMPDLTGFEVVRRLQVAGNTTLIIMVTANDIDRDTVLAQGCQDLLTKPFHLSDLYEVVQKHLRRQVHCSGNESL